MTSHTESYSWFRCACISIGSLFSGVCPVLPSLSPEASDEDDCDEEVQAGIQGGWSDEEPSSNSAGSDDDDEVSGDDEPRKKRHQAKKGSASASSKGPGKHTTASGASKTSSCPNRLRSEQDPHEQ